MVQNRMTWRVYKSVVEGRQHRGHPRKGWRGGVKEALCARRLDIQKVWVNIRMVKVFILFLGHSASVGDGQCIKKKIAQNDLSVPFTQMFILVFMRTLSSTVILCNIMMCMLLLSLLEEAHFLLRKDECNIHML